VSWHKTTVEGKTMWENCNGERVSSLEDVEAIERADRDRAEGRRNRRRW
jgi:hypothetical protein